MDTIPSQKVSIGQNPEFQKKCSEDLIPKTLNNSDFLSFLYSKPLWEYKKSQFRISDRVGISRYKRIFRKRYKPQFTKEVFDLVAISSGKCPTYTPNNEQDEIMIR